MWQLLLSKLNQWCQIKFFSKIKQNHENLNFLLCVNSAQYSNKNNGIIMYCYPVIYFLLEEPEHREL